MAYRQHILLRITQEARDQNALLTIKDFVKLVTSSYSTIKRDLKYFREREIFVPLRGIIKDICPSSHKSKMSFKKNAGMRM
jgi:DeoR/GlpR family transcriptional regulator of sugar metabolism